MLEYLGYYSMGALATHIFMWVRIYPQVRIKVALQTRGRIVPNLVADFLVTMPAIFLLWWGILIPATFYQRDFIARLTEHRVNA